MTVAAICGGRKYVLDALDWRRLDALHAGDGAYLGGQGVPVGPFSCIYQGEATGADQCAKEWAESRGIPVLGFPADWNTYGKGAGPIRNNAILGGHGPAGVVPEPELVIAFPGGAGTADMVAQARARDVPVLDLRVSRAQRWGPEHIADLQTFANYFTLADTGKRSVDASRRAALRICALAHGGLGIPCASAHLFRTPGADQITLPPGALYCGRPGMIGLRHMQLPEDGDGSVLGNPTVYKGGVPEDEAELAMGKYRSHLRALYKEHSHVRDLIHRIGQGETLLVCWCHASKPCHTTVIAEAALLVRARRELQELGLHVPPRRALSSRSTPTPPGTTERQPGAHAS